MSRRLFGYAMAAMISTPGNKREEMLGILVGNTEDKTHKWDKNNVNHITMEDFRSMDDKQRIELYNSIVTSVIGEQFKYKGE